MHPGSYGFCRMPRERDHDAAELGANAPAPAIDVRRWAEPAVEMRRAQSSERRTRCRWSNTRTQMLEDQADKAGSRQPSRWPVPLRRRLRSHRPARRPAHDRMMSVVALGRKRSRAKLYPISLHGRPQNERRHQTAIAARRSTHAPLAHCCRGNARTPAETGSPALKARAAIQA